MPKREKANFSHVWWPNIYCLSLGLGKCSPQQLWGNSNLCTATTVRYLCKRATFIIVLDSLFRILALPQDPHCCLSNSTNPWWIGSLQALREQLNSIHKSWGYVQVWPHWVFCVPNEAYFPKIEAGAEYVKYLEHGCVLCTLYCKQAEICINTLFRVFMRYIAGPFPYNITRCATRSEHIFASQSENLGLRMVFTTDTHEFRNTCLIMTQDWRLKRNI